MYEVTDFYLLKLYKETQIVVNTANTGNWMDSFLPTAVYEQKMFSNQEIFWCKHKGKLEKIQKKSSLEEFLKWKQ